MSKNEHERVRAQTKRQSNAPLVSQSIGADFESGGDGVRLHSRDERNEGLVHKYYGVRSLESMAADHFIATAEGSPQHILPVRFRGVHEAPRYRIFALFAAEGKHVKLARDSKRNSSVLEALINL
jgi:hypothetical protein